MIFLKINKIPLPEYMGVSKKCSTLQFFGRRGSPWTLDASGITQQAFSAVSFLRGIRPKFYGDTPIVLAEQLSNLPQINMGADPIINSAKIRQGRRNSNHGGK